MWPTHFFVLRALQVRPTAFAADTAAATAAGAGASGSGADVEAVPPELLGELASVRAAVWEGQDVKSSGRPELGAAK